MKNENKKIPQIRFKGFDTEWTSKNYTDVFDTSVSNNTLSRAELTTEKTSTKNVHYGDVLIKYNSILDVRNDDFPFIPDEIKIDSKDLLKNGDIVFADTAEDETCGKATEIYNLENENVTAGLHTFVARPKEKFEAKYLGYYINSPAYHNQLLPYMQGTKVTSISKSNIQKTTVKYPHSYEQKKLGTLYSEIDSLLFATYKEYNKLVTLKKCMLQKMFPNKKNSVPEIRFKGFFENWEEKRLGDICDVRDGTHDSPKYVSKHQGHPFITSKNVSNGWINYNDVQYISDEDFIEYNKRSKVDVKDILMGMIGTIGNVALVRKEPDYAIKNVALIKHIPNLSSELFVFFFLQSSYTKEQFGDNIDGGTQKFIALNKVRELKILLPKLDEQKKIGSYFINLDNLISKKSAELNKLNNIKKTLLSKMFV